MSRFRIAEVGARSLGQPLGEARMPTRALYLDPSLATRPCARSSLVRLESDGIPCDELRVSDENRLLRPRRSRCSMSRFRIAYALGQMDVSDPPFPPVAAQQIGPSPYDVAHFPGSEYLMRTAYCDRGGRGAL
jgi:hypothetical protein